eukprot:m.27051 g.27051  ORF g.27051 m.27051 type:complete len:197 (-) comp7857_c0_seq1:1422-2012(-)
MASAPKVLPKSAWQSDRDAPNCMSCNSLFQHRLRRHHCRFCGRVFCDTCSQWKLIGHRCCKRCHGIYATFNSGTASPTGRPSHHQRSFSSTSEDGLIADTDLRRDNQESPEYEEAPLRTEKDTDVFVSGARAIALYDLVASSSLELNIIKGMSLSLRDEVNSQWVICTAPNGQSGLVPLSHILIVEERISKSLSAC